MLPHSRSPGPGSAYLGLPARADVQVRKEQGHVLSGCVGLAETQRTRSGTPPHRTTGPASLPLLGAGGQQATAVSSYVKPAVLTALPGRLHTQIETKCVSSPGFCARQPRGVCGRKPRVRTPQRPGGLGNSGEHGDLSRRCRDQERPRTGRVSGINQAMAPRDLRRGAPGPQLPGSISTGLHLHRARPPLTWSLGSLSVGHWGTSVPPRPCLYVGPHRASRTSRREGV